MTGNPPLQTLVVALALGALVVPLVRLTRSAPTTAPATDQAPGKESSQSAYLRLQCAHAPVEIKIQHEGAEIFSSAVSELEQSTQVPLPLRAEGVELLVTARWPEGTPNTALTVTLALPGRDEHVSTLWSTGPELTGVVLVK